MHLIFRNSELNAKKPMGSTTVQLRMRGSLTIPAELRQRYGFDDGDVFNLIDLGDGTLVFTPQVALVPKLVAEMQAIREEAGVSLEEILADLSEERRRRYEESLAVDD